jgi:hypothetical protein
VASRPIDYNSFGRDGKPPPQQDGPKASARWWIYEGQELADALSMTLEFLKEHQQYRSSQWVIAARLYGNMALVGKAGLVFSRVANTQSWLKDRISWNCVQAATDTVTSRIAKNKPKPLFLTSGGDYKIQQKAKKLNKFVDGVFYENDAYKLGTQAFLDGCVWGDGVIHVYAENKRVKYERVMSSELHVDELDGFYGKPRSMHRAKDVDRAVLLEQLRAWCAKDDKKQLAFKEHQVKEAKPSNPDEGEEFIADRVELVESWHLPSGPEANDGKHVISIKGTVLVEEAWEHDFFPFARFQWSPRLYGFFSQGLAEQLQNIQLEINTLLATIKQSFWKGGTFRILLPTGSKVVKDHITNQIGAVISYTGTKEPTVVTPPLVQPEIFQHLMSLWQKAFEQAGVSLLSAAALKPAGLDSGAALREYNDIQSDRFMTIGQGYERLFLDLAKISIAVVKDITKGHASYRVKVPSAGKFIEEIDWKDVNLTDDQYVMKCFPVSSLPQDPAGRLQTIQEWVQAGWINGRQGKRLMDFPDLEMAENLFNAAEDYLTQLLETMIDSGDYTPPEPYDDLALARELALEFYQRGKFQKLEEEKLELLRTFLKQIQALEAQAAAAAQPPAQALPASTPQAVPEPPPMSPLLPNAPPPPMAAA